MTDKTAVMDEAVTMDVDIPNTGNGVNNDKSTTIEQDSTKAEEDKASPTRIAASSHDEKQTTTLAPTHSPHYIDSLPRPRLGKYIPPEGIIPDPSPISSSPPEINPTAPTSNIESTENDPGPKLHKFKLKLTSSDAGNSSDDGDRSPDLPEFPGVRKKKTSSGARFREKIASARGSKVKTPEKGNDYRRLGRKRLRVDDDDDREDQSSDGWLKSPHLSWTKMSLSSTAGCDICNGKSYIYVHLPSYPLSFLHPSTFSSGQY